MIIYNYNKEFVGIDLSDLKTLGYKDLASLRLEAADFADLFVKTPGHIHNFKHVHWLDFISASESSGDPKVIIHANNKNFKATLQIHTIFLIDNPSAKAYSVQLNNVRELTHLESERIAGDLLERPAPKVASAAAAPVFNTPEFSGDFQTDEEPKNVIHDPYESNKFDDKLDIIDIDDSFVDDDLYEDNHLAQANQASFTPPPAESYESADRLELDFEDEVEEEIIPQAPKKKIETSPAAPLKIEEDDFDYSYVYNPQIASDDLGLPVDLIEEFITDFIAQAHEFKEKLYASLNEGDLDNVKALSHKLKGVAANLRIENAFEVLSTINHSSDVNEITRNLKYFYNIIALLEGKEIAPQAQEPSSVAATLNETPDMNESYEQPLFEEEPFENEQPIEVSDDDVPERIELAELADDEFLRNEQTAHQHDQSDFEERIEIDFEDDTVEDDIFIANEEQPSFEYDKAKIADEIGIDLNRFNDFLQDYVTEARTLLESMRHKLETDQLEGIKREASKLMSMSENMRVGFIMGELNTLLGSTDSLEIAGAIQNIETMLSQISTIEA